MRYDRAGVAPYRVRMNADFGQIDGEIAQDASFQSWQKLREAAILLMREWKIVAACAVLALLWAAYQVHTAIPIYSAQMIVTPVQTTGEDTNVTARLNGALGNLASLAGVQNPNAQTATQFRLYVDSLQSRDLGEDLARDQTLMKTLFANEWDQDTQSWREPERGLGSHLLSGIKSLLGYPPAKWQPPDGARMQQFLIYQLHVTQDVRKAYLVTISFDWYDPAFAVRFLQKVNAAADNHLRQKSLTRARQYIQYLSNKLDTVTIAEHRAAIMNSLSEQEKYEMVASSASPFAADFFDAPAASDVPVWPQPRGTYLRALLEGLLAGAVLAYIWARWGEGVRRRFGR